VARLRAGGVAIVLVMAVCACTDSGSGPAGTASTTATTPAASAAPAASGSGAPTGTPGWQLTHPGPEHAIEGFADKASVAPGEPVRLFVSTTAARYTVTAFRIGAYPGSDALSVWTSAPQAGAVQPPAVIQEPTHTVEAPCPR